MKINKTIKVVVLAVAAVILVIAGVITYRVLDRRRAERDAEIVLAERTKLLAKGYPESPEAKAEVARQNAKIDEVYDRCGEDFHEELIAARMDGAFIVGDYAKAEQLMSVYPGMTESWRKGAAAKIRAHAALEKGDKATALKEFGVFVDYLRQEKDDFVQTDPTTGEELTRDDLLIHNLKRMAVMADELKMNAEFKKMCAEIKQLKKKKAAK